MIKFPNTSNMPSIEYRCKICDYTSKKRTNVIRHEKGKHEGDSQVCKLCDFSASWHSSLVRHVKAVHLEKTYPCSACNKVFNYNIIFTSMLDL